MLEELSLLSKILWARRVFGSTIKWYIIWCVWDLVFFFHLLIILNIYLSPLLIYVVCMIFHVTPSIWKFFETVKLIKLERSIVIEYVNWLTFWTKYFKKFGSRNMAKGKSYHNTKGAIKCRHCLYTMCFEEYIHTKVCEPLRN